MTIHDEMACQDLVDLVTEYLESTLSAAERTRFEAHLTGCDGCITYLDQMRESVHLTGRLAAIEPPPETRTKLVDAFRKWRSI